MAGDAGQHIDIGAGIELEIELAGGQVIGKAGRQRKGRAAELGRIDAEEQMMHHRIADEDDFENVA